MVKKNKNVKSSNMVGSNNLDDSKQIGSTKVIKKNKDYEVILYNKDPILGKFMTSIFRSKRWCKPYIIY